MLRSDIGYVSASPPHLMDLQSLIDASEIAVDIEGTGTHAVKDFPYGYSITANDHEAYYADMANRFMLDIVADDSKWKIMFNGKYDRTKFKQAGVIFDRVIDPLIAAHLLELMLAHTNNLEDMSYRVLGDRAVEMTRFKELPHDLRTMSVQEMAEFSGPHALNTLLMWKDLEKQLRTNRLWDVFWKIEMPVLPVLSDMEENGAMIDTKALTELGEYYEKKKSILKSGMDYYAEGYKAVGTNWNSPDQVANLFYDKMGLPKPPAWTYKGKKRPSVDKKLLLEIVGKVPNPPDAVKLYLKYREYTHMQNTYVDGILKRMYKGRIHTNFNQNRTSTGRLSCVAAGTMVATGTGYLPIESIPVGEYAKVSSSTGVISKNWSYGKASTVLMKFSDGGTIRPTLEHKFLQIGANRKESFTPVRDLKSGDVVWLSLAALPGTHSIKLPKEFTSLFNVLDEGIAEFLGLCTAEQCHASFTKTTLGSNTDEQDVRDHINSFLNRFPCINVRRQINGGAYTTVMNSKELVSALGSVGMNVYSSERSIPKILFNAPWRIRAAYLRGLFTGDGVDPIKDIALVTSSSALAQDVRLLLNSLGIMSVVSWYDTWATSTMKHGNKWYVRVPAMSYKAFKSMIGYIGVKNSHLIKKINETDFSRTKYSFGIGRLSREYIQIIKDSNYTMIPVAVESIEKAEDIDIYDLQVNNINRYSANGYITHNSTDPCLQNIPQRSEEGRKIRKSFIARPGCLLVKSDYEQMELRKMADSARCWPMIDAFNSKRDIHTETAIRAYNDAKRRADGKTKNFQLIYGGGSEADKELMFSIYPQIKTWTDKMYDEFESLGESRSMFGRRMTLSEGGCLSQLRQDHKKLFEEFARSGMSLKVQGSCSEICKNGMVKVWKYVRDSDIKMILQVHDEIVLEVPEKLVPDVVDLLYEQMEYHEGLLLSMPVEVKVGKNWGDMEKVKHSVENPEKLVAA